MPLVAILGFDLFPFRLDRSLSANGIGGRNDALIVAIILHQLEWIIQIIGQAVAKIANELQRDVLLHARHLFLLTVEAESFKDTVSCLVGDGAKSSLRAKAVANPDTISARWTETDRQSTRLNSRH